MQIVGRDDAPFEADHVHTIDVWYSRRRARWVVERVSADGHHIGHAAQFATEAEASHCVAEWLRAHSETVFVGASQAVRGARAAGSVRRAA